MVTSQKLIPVQLGQDQTLPDGSTTQGVPPVQSAHLSGRGPAAAGGTGPVGLNALVGETVLPAGSG